MGQLGTGPTFKESGGSWASPANSHPNLHKETKNDCKKTQNNYKDALMIVYFDPF